MTISTDKLVDSADINLKFTDIDNKLNQKVSKTGNESISGNKTFNNKIQVTTLEVTSSGKSKTPSANSNSTDIATTAWVKTALKALEPDFEKITPPGTGDSNPYKNFCKFPNGLLIQWGYVNTRTQNNHESIQTINFPTRFSENRSYSFVVTVSENVAASKMTGTVYKTYKQFDSTGVSQTATSIQINGYRDQVPYFWIAIGY